MNDVSPPQFIPPDAPRRALQIQINFTGAPPRYGTRSCPPPLLWGWGWNIWTYFSQLSSLGGASCELICKLFCFRAWLEFMHRVQEISFELRKWRFNCWVSAFGFNCPLGIPNNFSSPDGTKNVKKLKTFRYLFEIVVGLSLLTWLWNEVFKQHFTNISDF